MLVGLVDNQSLDAKQLKILSDRIAKAKTRKR
jgi:hypothetical protein